MTPSIEQHLKSIKRCLERVVIPELPATAALAQEQARHVVRALDHVIQLNDLSYRYAVVENVEYRSALAELTKLLNRADDPEGLLGPITTCSARPAPAAEEALLPLTELCAQNKELKKLLIQAWHSIRDDDLENAKTAREVVLQLAKRQLEREAAALATTGEVASDNPLADILCNQSA